MIRMIRSRSSSGAFRSLGIGGERLYRSRHSLHSLRCRTSSIGRTPARLDPLLTGSRPDFSIKLPPRLVGPRVRLPTPHLSHSHLLLRAYRRAMANARSFMVPGLLNSFAFTGSRVTDLVTFSPGAPNIRMGGAVRTKRTFLRRRGFAALCDLLPTSSEVADQRHPRCLCATRRHGCQVVQCQGPFCRCSVSKR